MSDSASQGMASERLSPNEIVSKVFSVHRRGFRTEEVMRYLAYLASYVGEQNSALDQLTAMRSQLETDVAQLKARKDPILDVATVAAILGEEAAEVLRSATEASEAIRARANLYAAEVTARADSEVASRRLDLENEASLKFSESAAELEKMAEVSKQRAASEIEQAQAEAAATVVKAREHANEMVSKAKIVRSQVYEEIRNRTAEVRAELASLQVKRNELLALFAQAQEMISGLGNALDQSDGYGFLETGEDQPEASLQEKTGLDLPLAIHHPAVVHGDELTQPTSETFATMPESGGGYELLAQTSASPESEATPSSVGYSRPRFVFDDLDGDPSGIETAAIEPVQSDLRISSLDISVSHHENLVENLAVEINIDHVAEEAPEEQLQEPVVIIEMLETQPEIELQPAIDSQALSEEFDDGVVAGATSIPISDDDSVPVVEQGDAKSLSVRQSSVQGIFARLLSDVDTLPGVESVSNIAATVEPEQLGEVEIFDAAVAPNADVIAQGLVADALVSLQPHDLSLADESAISELPVVYDPHHCYQELFSPIQAQVSRRIKRVLQDDQNELLDRLRTTGDRKAAGLIGTVDHLSERYLEVLSGFVESVARASREFYGQYVQATTGDSNLLGIAPEPSGEMYANANELARELADEVMGRIERVLSRDESDEDASLASNFGAAFRELKTEYVEPLTRDLVTSLVGGWLLSCSDVKKVAWLRSAGPGCSDCEDNELAGALDSGTEFPTGSLSPPAHIGCECLLVPDFA